MKFPLMMLPLLLAACGDKEGTAVATSEICDDGLDNDGNGVADCADSACASAAECDSGGDEGGDAGGDEGGNEDWPALVINEFMASNATTLEDSAGAYPDWVELYNPTGEDVDLTDWTITDNLENIDKSVLASLTVKAGDFLILYADDDQEEGDDHVNFSLDAEGEEIGLYAPDGSAVDELTYEAQATDVSMARVPDGSSTWAATDEPTPGESNGS